MRLTKRAGFTFIEILIVMVIIGIVAAVSIPRLRGSQNSLNVRSARAAMQTLVAKTRAAAIQRGCAATLHLVAGQAWVTTCRIRTTGGTLDTLGGIENLASRYNVTMAQSADSLRFDARGINSLFQATTVRFTSSSVTDSVRINTVGKVVR